MGEARAHRIPITGVDYCIRLFALLYMIACTTIFGWVHYYITCATLVLALVYCNFLRVVRLGGWCTEGPEAPTSGQCVRHHSFRKWKYIVRFEII